jgi:hypothetical protein
LLPWSGYAQVFDTVSVVTRYPEERSRLIWQDRTFLPLGLRPDSAPAEVSEFRRSGI